MTDGRLTNAEALTHVARQILGSVLTSWRRTLRIGLIAAAVTFLLAEVGACLVTGSFPPSPIAHLATAALAVAVGYSVALTALFALVLRGGVWFIHHLEGDLTVAAEAASVFARREVGDLSAGLRQIFSGVRGSAGKKSPRPAVPSQVKPATKRRPNLSPRAVVASAAVATVGMDIARIARTRGLPTDVRRDPDDAIIRTPPPALQSLPVLAAHLPRIGWTYDEQSTARPASPRTTMPPPQAPASAPPSLASSAPAPTSGARPAPVAPAAPAAPDVSEPLQPGGGTPDAPGLIPRGWRRADPTTRPLPAITRPLPTPGGAHSGGLWDRVSQALVGQTPSEAQPAGDVERRADEQPPIPDVVAPEDAWLNG